MTRSSILVVGGSLGGLIAANLLLRAGHRVTVLEKASQSLDGRGAGIVTHAGLLTALRAAGAVVDDSLGVAVQQRVALDTTGAVQAQLDRPQVLSSWSRLYALLRHALPDDHLLPGHSLTEIEQTCDSVHVTCANGAHFDADLLLASDGIRSTVRGRLAPEVQPIYARYVAWRGVCNEAALSATTRQTLFPHFGFGLPDGEQIIGYPVAGPGNSTLPCQRRYNFVWYRPADEALALRHLLTDDDGQHHPGGIAPQRVAARQIAQMRADAARLLAPQWAEVIAKTEQPFVQPIYDLASTQIAFGRIALLGDAAFVARPHVGMGVTKAAADALALQQALNQHGATPAALRAYQAERLPAGMAVVALGRELGAYLQDPQRSTRTHRQVMDVLTDTAVDPTETRSDRQQAVAA